MHDTSLLPGQTLPDGAVLRPAAPDDLAGIARLHARVFGPGRFTRSAYRVREGTPDLSPLCHVMLIDGEPVAAIRMTPVKIGGRPGAALLGPLVVDDRHQRKTFGRRLILASLDASKARGLQLVVLVGDLDYYGEMGFFRLPPGRIQLPGPVDPLRLLAAELTPGALQAFAGQVHADLDPAAWSG